MPLEIGREEAIRLEKQYVHNDICFPAQIVVGEILAALRSGQYDIGNVAVGMGKYVGDCRLTHYSALLRKAMDLLIEGMEQGGIRGAARGFEKAVALMKDLDYDRSRTKPQVLIVGEYLLNFHPGANHDIEAYLEENGFEVIEARMTDVIRKTYFNQDTQIKEYHLKKPVGEKAWFRSVDIIFNLAHDLTDKIAAAHPLYTPACRMQDIVKQSDSIIHHTFDAGEGVLIPAEILHHAENGCRCFIILQPFGCLPNHIVGRGISKRLKVIYPDVQILSLDYDPDVSPANIENRLQMLKSEVLSRDASGRKTC